MNNTIKGLISVLTPCYNTAHCLHRLMDSILEQDYPSVEMIAVDDGSSDNTLEVLNGYMQRFEERGYSLTVLHQENSGQSAAINNALKLARGEYIVWPDSDDWYHTPKALSTFVDAFEQLPEDYGEVRCPPRYVPEHTNDGKVIGLNEEHLNPEQFLNCLHSSNFFWGAGNYMIRSRALDTVNPQREIYVEKNAGQNWQMHLPILYKYKCHTLKESLHSVLERADSHSRGQFKAPKQEIAKIQSYENTILSTLESMERQFGEDLTPYKRDISRKYNMQLLSLSCRNQMKGEAYKYADQLRQIGDRLSLMQRMELLSTHSRLSHTLYYRGLLPVVYRIHLIVSKFLRKS